MPRSSTGSVQYDQGDVEASLLMITRRLGGAQRDTAVWVDSVAAGLAGGVVSMPVCHWNLALWQEISVTPK
jgi:hypothetical protein